MVASGSSLRLDVISKILQSNLPKCVFVCVRQRVTRDMLCGPYEFSLKWMWLLSVPIIDDRSPNAVFSTKAEEKAAKAAATKARYRRRRGLFVPEQPYDIDVDFLVETIGPRKAFARANAVQPVGTTVKYNTSTSSSSSSSTSSSSSSFRSTQPPPQRQSSKKHQRQKQRAPPVPVPVPSNPFDDQDKSDGNPFGESFGNPFDNDASSPPPKTSSNPFD